MKSAKASNPDVVVVAYVPVLHAGYQRFFKREAGTAKTLYVLGPRYIREIDRLRKEIRALEPAEVVKAVKAWELFKHINVLDAAALKKIKAGGQLICMPDEDVSREFAQLHLTEKDIRYSPVFLRWDRDNSKKERKVREDAKISRKRFDRNMMDAATKASQRTSDWWRQVGAVLVKDGMVLMEAQNQHRPSPHTPWVNGDPRNNLTQGDGIELSTAQHAESRVIAEAARKGIALDGADIYVTDFPCPPCAKLIAYSGIKRCYFERGYAVLDGQTILKQNGVEIIRVEGGQPERDPKAFLPYPEKKS